MRIVVAPDSFGGSMRADIAAVAFAAGWQAVAPDDDLDIAPLSDGGTGLIAALASAVPEAVVSAVTCSGPTGLPVEAEIARVGSTAYVESAMACGLEPLRSADGDVRTATTYGVGELLTAAAAIDGVDTVIVGLGGSGTNDGGAGLWAALGAEPEAVLRAGGAGLKVLESVVVPPALSRSLVAAADVDNPLLGLHGASAVFGPQKGADRGAVMSMDVGLERWADVVEAAIARTGVRDLPGSGAAGGLGFGLLALGATRVSGIELVMDAVGLAGKIATADLVVTGEGRFDATSLRGKVPSGVARVAQEAGIPCIVVAGQAEIGAREAAAHGIDEVWTVAELLGSAQDALAAGSGGLVKLGQAVARSWSR